MLSRYISTTRPIVLEPQGSAAAVSTAAPVTAEPAYRAILALPVGRQDRVVVGTTESTGGYPGPRPPPKTRRLERPASSAVPSGPGHAASALGVGLIRDIERDARSSVAA